MKLAWQSSSMDEAHKLQQGQYRLTKVLRTLSGSIAVPLALHCQRRSVMLARYSSFLRHASDSIPASSLCLLATQASLVLQSWRSNRFRPFLKILTDSTLQLHPWCQQNKAVAWCHSQKMVVQAYSPIRRNSKANEPTLKGIADKHKKTTAQVLIR